MPFPVRSRGAVALISLGLLVALVPGSAAGAPAPDTLFPTQGNPGYQVRSYHVRLDYAPGTNRIDAVATIRATARHSLSDFHLDLAGLTVRDVRVDGKPATWTRQGHELVIEPRHDVDGRFTTRVEYAGVPRAHTDPDGSTEGWVRTSDGAVAVGEPVGTMTWLPSNNTPGDKARFTFVVTAPSSVQAVANGNLASRAEHGARTTWTWRSPDRMSTYLAHVAIGRFAVFHSTMRSITGRTIPLWSFVDPTTGNAAAARKLLPEVILFEEKLFGAYPFTSAGMVIDPARIGYALETQSRPYFPYSPSTGLLVHELAHQWYGDSVTLRDWHDIWLAEGFATYAEWLWSAAHGGSTPAQRFESLYAAPAGDDLWHPAPTEFTDPADLFGTPVYTRGAMTLQALRMAVGGPDFFAILRAWAKEHRHGNAGTPQLRALAERISGEDLDTLFSDWLELDGRPEGY